MEKILVIDKSKGIYEKLLDIQQNYEIYEGELVHSFVDLKDYEPYEKVVIDVESIEDIDEFIDKNKKKENIVVVMKYQSRVDRNRFLLSGMKVHFRNLSIHGLIYQLFEIVEFSKTRETFIEKSIEKNTKGNIILCTSPVGGVGKSTISMNMAYKLATLKKKVLYVDLSTIGNTDIDLQVRIESAGINEFIEYENEEKINTQEEVKVLQKSIVAYKNKGIGFDVLYGTNPIKMEQIDETFIERLVMILRKLEYEYIIIDTSSELNNKNLTLIELADIVYIIGIADIRAGWKLLQFREILDYLQLTKKCKLVINKYNKFYGFSCKDFESEMQMEIVSILPFSKEITYYSNIGRIVASDKKLAFNKYINHLVSHVCDEVKPKEMKILKVNK